MRLWSRDTLKLEAIVKAGGLILKDASGVCRVGCSRKNVQVVVRERAGCR